MASISHAFASQNTTQTVVAGYVDLSGGVLTSGNFTAGKKYLIVASAQGTTSTAPNPIGFRLAHGGTAFSETEAVYWQPSGFSGYYANYGWFTVWTAVSGEAISLQASAFSASTVTVDFVALGAINLSDDVIENTDWVVNERSTNDALSTTPTSGATITFTPGTASQDWLVLCGAQVQQGDTTTSAVSDLVRSGEASSTEPSTRHEMTDRSTNQDLMMFLTSRVFTLGAASNTFTEQSSTSSGTAHTRTHSIVFALNLHMFKDHAFVYTSADTSIDSTSNYVTQIQTMDMAVNTTGDVLFGTTWGFDKNNATHRCRFRTQVYVVGESQVDLPSGQTTAAHQIKQGGDTTDETPQALIYLSSLTSGNTYRFDVDASVNSTTGTPAAQHRSLWAFSMELAAVSDFPVSLFRPWWRR